MNDTWEKKEEKKTLSVSSVSRAYIFSFSPQSKVVCLIFYKWQSIKDGKLESNAQDQLHTIRASTRTLLSLVEGQADANVKCKFCSISYLFSVGAQFSVIF